MSLRPQWKFLITYRGPSHFVPPDLADLTLQDLTARGAPPEIKSTPSGFFDLPECFVSCDRKVFTVELDGLTLEMPCAQWGEILTKLKRLAERRFDDGTPYYKLHGFHKCIVLSPAHRDSMLAQMETRLEESHKIADQELEDMRLALERINAKGGVQVAAKRFPSTWPVGMEVDFTK